MKANNIGSETIAIIPCYNEQNTVGYIVNQAFKYVDKVIVINDGSKDKTRYEAKKAGAVLLEHQCNLGKGRAIKTAFDYLCKIDYKAVVILDGDGQHDPNEIPRIISPILHKTADMVIGSRFLEDSHNIPLYRRVGQTVLNLVTSAGAKIQVTDSQSGFRSFSKLAVKKMNLKEKGFAVESEMQFIAAMHKLKVQEVPITALYKGKTKRSPVIHGFGVLFRIILLILSNTPG